MYLACSRSELVTDDGVTIQTKSDVGSLARTRHFLPSRNLADLRDLLHDGCLFSLQVVALWFVVFALIQLHTARTVMDALAGAYTT